MKYLIAILVFSALCIPGMLLAQSDAPDPLPAEGPLSPEAGVMYVGYVVLSPEDDEWQFAHDQAVHAKLDAIIEHLGIIVGPDTRPNLNTMAEQELFGLMSTANIYRARSMAALIWSHIHDGGNTITAKQDLLDIVGVGDKTADALWPLIKTTDREDD